MASVTEVRRRDRVAGAHVIVLRVPSVSRPATIDEPVDVVHTTGLPVAGGVEPTWPS